MKTILIALMYILPAVGIAGFIYSYCKNRTFKGILFNCRVKQSFGKVSSGRGLINSSVEVMSLDDKETPVGLYCVQSGAFGSDHHPLKFSTEQANEIIRHMQDAIKDIEKANKEIQGDLD